METFNRKLLVSVFNAQEAREAVLGGARIVDSEGPKSALGNIKPRHIITDKPIALSTDGSLKKWTPGYGSLLQSCWQVGRN